MADKRQQRRAGVLRGVGQGLPELTLMRRDGLAPDRHGGDFFVCDILDALPKDDMASMEHPLFSLATRPDRRILDYAHNDVRITVVPSVRGLATLFDKDILIYCISQLVAALNAGRPVGRELRLTAHDLMLATNRETAGDGYARLREAFERLAGTRITTNLVTGDQEVTTGFGLIEGWQIVRATRGGRMVQVCGHAVGLALPGGAGKIGADAEPRLFPAAKTAGAAGLRAGTQTLRTPARLADLDPGAGAQVRLGQPLAGVPPDDPRHDCRGSPA